VMLHSISTITPPGTRVLVRWCSAIYVSETEELPLMTNRFIMSPLDSHSVKVRGLGKPIRLGDVFPLPEANGCRFGVYCVKHGFIHGAEAEELRERIETLTAEITMDAAADLIADELQEILDDVDARDSLAWHEQRLLESAAQETDPEHQEG